MASKIAEKAPSWLTRILLPEIAEIRGELKSLNSRIDSTNVKIDEMDKRVISKIDDLDKRLSENDRRLSEKFDDLDKRLDMAQRLAVVEAKLREREKS
jgi:chromosome segregation ATPase